MQSYTVVSQGQSSRTKQRTKPALKSCVSSGKGLCLMAGMRVLDSGLPGSLFSLLRYSGTLSVISELAHCSELFFLFHLHVTRSEGEKSPSALPMLLSDVDLLRVMLTVLSCFIFFFSNCHLRDKLKPPQKE